MALGDASGRLSLLSLRSQNRKLSDAAPEYHVKTVASSEALLVEHNGRGDLLAGGVSGIVRCFAFNRNLGPAGSTVIAATSDGRICFFIAAPDLLSLWPASVVCTGEVIRCIALAGTGQDSIIAVSGNSGVVRVWDASCEVLRFAIRDRSEALIAMTEQVHDVQMKPPSPQMFHSSEISSATLAGPVSETEIPSSSPHRHWITSLVTVRPFKSESSTLGLIGLTRRGDLLAWVAKR
jgi:WD40 repeat protein